MWGDSDCAHRWYLSYSEPRYWRAKFVLATIDQCCRAVRGGAYIQKLQRIGRHPAGQYIVETDVSLRNWILGFCRLYWEFLTFTWAKSSSMAP